jgi:flagellar motor switch protein FliG
LKKEDFWEREKNDKEEDMTTLSKLKTMKDVEIQNWLRKVGQDHVISLVIALLGSDEEVKDSVFRNMSKPAGIQLRKNLDQYERMDIKEIDILRNASDLEKQM